MSKYLYGASIQGIQSFIFQTNELKDILGASALVDYICKDFFIDNFLGNGTAIINAAGNIKCIFEDIKECERVVRLFPKSIIEIAPGITMSQAVVRYNEDKEFASSINELEKKLRAQRNKPMKSSTMGLMAVERSRKTGLPAISIKEGDFIDLSTAAKREDSAREQLALAERCFGKKHIGYNEIAYNIGKLTDKNNWIAIIHADGNGLGQIVAKIGSDKEKLRAFSNNLDEATTHAAQLAYNDTCGNGHNSLFPIRPIVLGGDDLTVICKADIAIKYVQAFLKHFEEQTEKKGYKLTACAGIAFIKASFPFHYGYNLAETLCERAKKDSKSISAKAPSCLMFHKVQSSFIENYNEIANKELTLRPGHCLEFGPYYLNETNDRWTVEQLLSTAAKFSGKDKAIGLSDKDGNIIKSDLRQWLTLMNESEGKAEQKKIRVENIDKIGKELFQLCTTPIKRGYCLHYPTYDILTVNTIDNQITR